MKYYTITVNGTAYEVSVEENTGATATPVATPASAPVAKAAPKKAPAPAASASAGSVKVAAPMPGKIITTKAAVGQTVKKGDVLLVLEAMKMENEVVAPQDGTIASINVSAGQSVESGDLLATLN